MFCCYEKASTGKWNIVAYKEKPPAHSVNGAGPERTTFFEPKGEFYTDGQINLSLVEAYYPLSNYVSET